MSYTPFNDKLEPIVLRDQFITVRFIDDRGGVSDRTFRVLDIEPLYEIVVNAGRIEGIDLATGEPRGKLLTPDAELKPLVVDKMELAQYRLRILEPVVVEFRLPRVLPRFRTKEAQTYMTPLSRPNLLEFFVYADLVPYLQVYNPSPDPVPMARLVFTGFKYKLELAGRPSGPSTIVTVYGGDPFAGGSTG